MDIQAIDSVSGSNGANLYNLSNEAQTPAPTLPALNNVQAFDQAMKATATKGADPIGDASKAEGSSESSTGTNNTQLDELLIQLIKLIKEMLGQVSGSEGGGKTHGGSIAGPGQGITPVEGTGPGGSAGNGDGLIPPPTEHIQQLNLGGKTVTVGGDGTASAEEVGATAQQIQHMYQNSPTFKNMIDSSGDPSFEVSVGRRSDNTSWGNSTGKVFMNINNIAPGNNDSFQSLLGHEFAHASIDIGHGSQMEQMESAIAREA